jgi:signal transduction histidine kinase
LILGEMKGAVDRANDVIMKLMDLSSPRDLGMHEVDLNSVIEQSLAALRDRLTQASIAVKKDLAENLPACSVDAAKIEQVFMNVLANAIDAVAENGTLTVATRVKTLDKSEIAFDAGDRSGARIRAGDSVVVVEITDTGTGIARENLSKLFEPFFSTKPTGKGMGLGLTVAKKLMELHGGTIHVRNLDGSGARATMIFPCAKEGLEPGRA